MSQPKCGAQQPSEVPSPFDWWPFAAVGVIGTAGAYVYASGIPVVNGIIQTITKQAIIFPSSLMTASFAGAAAILVLVLYFALRPDGCIRSTPKGQPICLSGIVQDTADTSSTAVAILAPFAMPPAGLFNVVVKTIYWTYVTQNSYWVYCSPAPPVTGSAMLPCIVQSESACGAKVGSLIGAAAGAIGGTVLGFLAGAALGCAATGPFYLLCLLVALIIAAVVAAAVTYAGAMVGGWIGQGIGSVGSDPVGDEWEALEAGTIVTVRGNWVTNPDVGNNELFYTTAISRTGSVDAKPPYSTAQADATGGDDCEIAPRWRP